MSRYPGIARSRSSRLLRLSRSLKLLGEQAIFLNSIEMSICAGLLLRFDLVFFLDYYEEGRGQSASKYSELDYNCSLCLEQAPRAHAFCHSSDNESSGAFDVEFSL